MPSQSSVAPKERVNIVYRPATEGAQAEVELPLKLLVLGDYTLRDDDTPLEEIEPVAVDKDNFDDVLAGQAPRLELQVPDMLSRQRGCTLALDLRFIRCATRHRRCSPCVTRPNSRYTRKCSAYACAAATARFPKAWARGTSAAPGRTRPAACASTICTRPARTGARASTPTSCGACNRMPR